jgi:NAD/NADP transhydrogenase alpha subunit
MIHSAVIFVSLIIIGLIIGLAESMDFINNFGVFCLSIFLGYAVIGRITSTLYTPLLTATTTIGGVILVGCIDAMTDLEQDSG